LTPLSGFDRQHLSHPDGVVGVVGDVITGAVGMDQDREPVAVDGQERRKFVEQQVGEDDLVHRLGMRADRSDVTTADQGIGKNLSDFFAQGKGPVHGGLRVVILDFSIDGFLNSANSLWAPQLQDKGLQFSIHNHLTEGDTIRSDKRRIRQVLYNLIGNAIKFTADGHIEVHLNNIACDDGRVELRFEVHDTGIGLSTDQIGKLFQPFAQADGSTTRNFGGTGLGLTISKKFVELLSDKIGVESIPGEGSILWFTVIAERADPRKEKHEPSDGGQRSSVVPWITQA
jgi:signal transduction histidine kinase